MALAPFSARDRRTIVAGTFYWTGRPRSRRSPDTQLLIEMPMKDWTLEQRQSGNIRDASDVKFGGWIWRSVPLAWAIAGVLTLLGLVLWGLV